MLNLYVNPPTENKDFDPDISLGKIVPIYVAQSLQQNEIPVRVDLWNNILATEMYGYSREEYREETKRRLDFKYSSHALRWLGKVTTKPQLLTDTTPEFIKWAQAKVDTSFEKGDTALVEAQVYTCENCSASICLAPWRYGEFSDLPSCSTCPGSANSIQTRLSLTTHINDDTIDQVNSFFGGNKAAALSNKNLLYGEVLISKQRVDGVGLEALGLPGEVLDPRVSLGLLALFAAEKNAMDQVNIVVARTSQTKNLPQFAAVMKSQLQDMPQLKMTGIPKVPVEYLRFLVMEGILKPEQMFSALYYKLAPALPKMVKEVTPQTAERIIFSRSSSI
jgi:hypothetical protein